MDTIQYIVVNKDLNMSVGKVAAQVAHAVNTAATEDDINAYFDANQRTVIVLEATGEQIRNLRDYLSARQITSDYVIDEGVNEIPTMSLTALATEQLDVDNQEVRDFFAGFNLYGESKDERAKKSISFINEVLVEDRNVKNIIKRIKNYKDEEGRFW